MSLIDAEFDVFRLATENGEPSWAGWYATPMDQRTAGRLRQAAHRTRQHLLACGGPTLGPQLAELVAAFWLGEAAHLQHRSLSAVAAPDRRPLADLVYGQLLMSRKLTGACELLARGFAAAAPLLSPTEYLVLLRRHELLAALVLADVPATPRTLSELLLEARIVRRLQPDRGRARPVHRPDDTLG